MALKKIWATGKGKETRSIPKTPSSASYDAEIQPQMQQPQYQRSLSSAPLQPPKRRDSTSRRPSEENWVDLASSTPMQQTPETPIASLPNGMPPPVMQPPPQQLPPLQPMQPSPMQMMHSPLPPQVVQPHMQQPPMHQQPSPYMTSSRPQSKKPQPAASPKQPPGAHHHVLSASFANGFMHANESQEYYEPSEQSHEKQKRGFFGTPREREKEKDAQQELVRMIGFLTATQSEDWSLVLEVCERASANEASAKEAARGLRREFKYAEPSAQLSAARLWAIMLRNSSELFILQTSSKKFLENLESVVTSPNTSPVVKERLLEVLGNAAYTYRTNGNQSFGALWRKVKPPGRPDEGLPFDPEDAMYSLHFPRRAGALGAQPPIQPPQPSPQPSPHPPYHHGHHRKEQRIIPPEEDMRRLFEECEMAKSHAHVLTDGLRFARPADLTADAVIREFHTKCRASQELIVAQIPWASAGAERAARAREAAAAKPNRLQKESKSKSVAEGSSKEERLLAALLSANQDILEAFRIYDDLERLGHQEREDREIAERSKKETRLDRAQIQYIAPDGSLVMSPSTGGQGGGPSRSPSPSPSLPHQAQHSPQPNNSSRDLPSPPSQQGHTQSGHHHSSSGQYYGLAPPPPPPHGPRQPTTLVRSRTPSPEHEQTETSSQHNHPSKGFDGVKGMAELDISESTGDDGELDPEVTRPSAKALGKRRNIEFEPEDPDDAFKDRSRSPYLGGSDFGDAEEEPSRNRWDHPVRYAYDAAAERAKERIAEAARAAAATAAPAEVSPIQPTNPEALAVLNARTSDDTRPNGVTKH